MAWMAQGSLPGENGCELLARRRLAMRTPKTCPHVCMYVCLYVCTYIYIYIFLCFPLRRASKRQFRIARRYSNENVTKCVSQINLLKNQHYTKLLGHSIAGKCAVARRATRFLTMAESVSWGNRRDFLCRAYHGEFFSYIKNCACLLGEVDFAAKAGNNLTFLQHRFAVERLDSCCACVWLLHAAGEPA